MNNQVFFACIGDLLATESVQSMGAITQHVQSVDCLAHCIFVAYVAFKICGFLHLHSSEAARGGLLHDMFLYNQHDPANRHHHLANHPAAALQNADSRFVLSPVERDAILGHMWPLNLTHPPKSREARVVCLADKVCSVAEVTHLYHLMRMNRKLAY